MLDQNIWDEMWRLNVANYLKFTKVKLSVNQIEKLQKKYFYKDFRANHQNIDLQAKCFKKHGSDFE